MRASTDGRDALPSDVSLLGPIDTDDVPANVPIALLIINLMRPDPRASEEDIDTWQALEDLYCAAYVDGQHVSQIEASLDVAGAAKSYLELPLAFARCVEMHLGNKRRASRVVVRLAGSRKWQAPLWMRHPAFEVTRG